MESHLVVMTARELQGNPVERALRNLHAIAFGMETARGHHRSAGRVLLGGKPLEPLF
jgi:hypothetical protein